MYKTIPQKDVKKNKIVNMKKYFIQFENKIQEFSIIIILSHKF